MHSVKATIALLALGSYAFAHAEPAVTAAAQLVPRATDPAFVGYISGSNGYSETRTCDYPDTLSTSGSYVQCCPTSGACPFFTACSSNTLIGGGTTVACDINPTLTCNTAVVLPTTSAAGGASYLACWQTSLGSGAITFVQNIGGATVASGSAASSSGSSTRSQATSSGTQSASSTRSTNSASAASTSSASTNAAAGFSSDLSSFGSTVLGGLMAIVAPFLL